MRIILLSTFLLMALCSFSQQRVVAASWHEYEMNGDTLRIDSVYYHYNSQQLGFSSFEPMFAHQGNEAFFTLELDFSDQYRRADLVEHYVDMDLNTSPLSYSYIDTNTLINGYVAESNNSNSARMLYEYDQMGNLTKRYAESLISNVWTVTDSTTFTYDALGNKLTETWYSVPSNFPMLSTDTLTYIPGTNNIERGVRYVQLASGDPVSLTYQIIVAHNGSQLLHYDQYDGISGSLVWTGRVQYEYGSNSADPIKYSAFFVNNNTVDPAPYIEILFEEDVIGHHYRTITISPVTLDTMRMVTYEYDQDYVTKATTERADAFGDFHVVFENFYYYEEAPLAIDEAASLEVLIYPNPSSDVVHVQSDQQINRIQLLSMNGQLLLEQDHDELNIEHLAEGSYLIVGLTDSGCFSKTIVKK